MKPPAVAVPLLAALEQIVGGLDKLGTIQRPIGFDEHGAVFGEPEILLPRLWPNPLFAAFADGSWVCWGHEERPLGPWTCFSADEAYWRRMRVEEWGLGILELVDQRLVQTFDASGIPRIKTETVVLGRWFGAVAAVTKKVGQASKRVSAAELREFFLGIERNCGRELSQRRAAMMAKKRFGARVTYRQAKEVHGEHRTPRRGRPPKC